MFCPHMCTHNINMNILWKLFNNSKCKFLQFEEKVQILLKTTYFYIPDEKLLLCVPNGPTIDPKYQIKQKNIISYNPPKNERLFQLNLREKIALMSSDST